MPRQAGFAKDRFRVLVLDLGNQLIEQLGGDELGCFLLLRFFGGHYVGHKIFLSVLFHDPDHTKNSDTLGMGPTSNPTTLGITR
jgi:hypothetical protein